MSDGASGPPAPPAPSVPFVPVQDAILDDATFSQLCFDLSQVAELRSIVERGPRGAVPIARPATAEGLAALASDVRSGATSSAQIRYFFEEQEWCDTITRVPGGIRLLRISHTRVLRAHALSQQGDES